MEQFTCHICSSWPLSTQYASDSILGNKVWTIKQSGPFTGERSISQSPGKDVQTVKIIGVHPGLAIYSIDFLKKVHTSTRATSSRGDVYINEKDGRSNDS